MAAEPAPILLAVVGGGIAGLGLAVGLLHHPNGPNPRLRVAVYESAPVLSEIGAGVAMGPNSVGAIELLSAELRRRLEARGMRIAGPDADSFACFRYGAAGEHEDALVVSVPGEGQSTLHRRHLVEELANMLPRDMVQYGKKAVRVTNNVNNVSIEFEDGTSETADFVIGADGIRSCTRRTVLGEDSTRIDPVFSGIYTYRNLVPMEDIEPVLGKDVARASNVFVGPSAWLVVFPVDDGRSVNLAAVTVTDKPWTHHSWTAPVPEGSVEQDYPADKWSKTAQGLLPYFRSGKLFALFDHPSTPIFYNDRVALIGDGAHASLPSQGSGAAMALEDALVLSRLLLRVQSEADVRAAFKGYDAVRRPRNTLQIETAHQAARVLSFREEGVGADIGKIKEQMEHRWDWIWGLDLEQHIREAEEAALRARAEMA